MPKPKKQHRVYPLDDPAKIDRSVIQYEDLPRDFTCPITDIFDLLESRQSRRHFDELSAQDLSTLLWYVQRQVGIMPSDPNRKKTPIPTAGALASVKTIVLGPAGDAWLYEPVNHKAGILRAPAEMCLNVRKESEGFFDIGEGTLLLFFASRPFIERYYDKPDSLVLREAGVLLGTLALVAEALNFSFCPLGTTGKDWLGSLLGVDKQIIIPAGAAVAGRR